VLHIGQGNYQEQAHAQLLPHTGPFLWWCPWPRALPSSVSSIWLPSPHQFSLSCGLHSYFTSKSAGTIFFVIKCNQIGPLQECVIEAFLWFPLGCSQVVTCFRRFHSHGSQHQSPVLVYNHLILKHLRSQITACKAASSFVRFLKHRTGSNGFFIKKIQEPATDGFLTKWNTHATLV
jgi:hypothetical protein